MYINIFGYINPSPGVPGVFFFGSGVAGPKESRLPWSGSAAWHFMCPGEAVFHREMLAENERNPGGKFRSHWEMLKGFNTLN